MQHLYNWMYSNRSDHGWRCLRLWHTCLCARARVSPVQPRRRRDPRPRHPFLSRSCGWWAGSSRGAAYPRRSRHRRQMSHEIRPRRRSWIRCLRIPPISICVLLILFSLLCCISVLLWMLNYFYQSSSDCTKKWY